MYSLYAVRSPNYLMSDVASINYLSQYTSYMTTISIYLYNQIFPQFVVNLIISDIIPPVNRLWKILSYSSESSRFFVHTAYVLFIIRISLELHPFSH